MGNVFGHVGGRISDAEAAAVFYAFKKKYSEILHAKSSVNREDKELAREVAKRIHAQLLLGQPGRVQLDLANTEVGDNACVALAHALRLQDSAVLVGLHNSNIGRKGIVELACLLKRSERLADLDLSANSLDSGSICVLAHSLLEHESRSGLTELSLSSCGVDDAGASALGDMLSHNMTLRVLDLSSNSVGLTGVQALSHGLLRNETLTQLDLRRNAADIHSEHTAEIDRVLERNEAVHDIVNRIFKVTTKVQERKFKAKRDTFKLSVQQKRDIQVQLAAVSERVADSGSGSKEKDTSSSSQPQPHAYAVLSTTTTSSMQASKPVGKAGAVASARFDGGCAEMQGRRPEMQDAIVLLGQFGGRKDQDCYGVFDGHGGREPAEYAARRLPDLIAQSVTVDVSTMRQAISDSFIKCGSEMAEWCPYRGTTVCVALVLQSMLWVANVGDSRAVLSREGVAIRLSVDHTPKLEEETRRITDLGGFVQDGRVSGLLAVSRAFGDSFLHPFVTAEPYVRNIELDDGDDFVIIACDGVWDVVSDQVAVNMVRKHVDSNQAAEELRDYAYAMGSTDNISAVVVMFKKSDEPDMFQVLEDETMMKRESVLKHRRQAAEAELRAHRLHEKQVARIVREEEVMRHRSQSEEDIREATEVKEWLEEHPEDEGWEESPDASRAACALVINENSKFADVIHNATEEEQTQGYRGALDWSKFEEIVEEV